MHMYVSWSHSVISHTNITWISHLNIKLKNHLLHFQALPAKEGETLVHWSLVLSHAGQEYHVAENKVDLKLLFVGLGLALDRSGWMMSVVLVLNHVSTSAQTMELDHTTVFILRMWPYTAVVFVSPVPSLHHPHLLPPVPVGLVSNTN